MTDSYTSSSSYYYSSTTNTTNGNTTTGHRYTTTSHTDPSGTTVVRTAHQDLGQPAVVEERRYDRTGQEQQMLTSGTETLPGGVRRITDLDDERGAGATAYDAGTAYGIPTTGGENERDERSRGDEWWSSSVGRSAYDFDIGTPLPGARTYNADTGAYEEQRADYDADGVPRYRPRGQSGYSAEQRATREFETDQGTRLRRESDVDMKDLL